MCVELVMPTFDLDVMCVSCTDINTAAANLTLRTGQHNQTLLNPVVCDLVRLKLSLVNCLLKAYVEEMAIGAMPECDYV